MPDLWSGTPLLPSMPSGAAERRRCACREGGMDIFGKKKTGLISRAIASDPLAGLGCGC